MDSSHAAKEYAMGTYVVNLIDRAIERCSRIFQHWRTGYQTSPLSKTEALCHWQLANARKRPGKLLMIMC